MPQAARHLLSESSQAHAIGMRRFLVLHRERTFLQIRNNRLNHQAMID